MSGTENQLTVHNVTSKEVEMSKKKERTPWPMNPIAVSVILPVDKNLTFCKGDEVEFRFHGVEDAPLGFALEAIGYKFRRENGDVIVTAKVRKNRTIFSPAKIGVNGMTYDNRFSC